MYSMYTLRFVQEIELVIRHMEHETQDLAFNSPRSKLKKKSQDSLPQGSCTNYDTLVSGGRSQESLVLGGGSYLHRKNK